MMDIRIANAPCSWGTLEFSGLEGERIAYGQMLDELRDTGYVGSELGDWGYMPTEPAALRAELERRNLAMVGAFVPVALKYPDAHTGGEAEALKVARLLADTTDTAVSPNPSRQGRQQGSPLPRDEGGMQGEGGQLPFVILADANGTDPVRTKHAGRVTPEMGLSLAEWETFARGAERIARTVREETGLPTAFHHHCAGYVETPEEIARFLDMIDADLLGLVFDTGHYLYGTGLTVGINPSRQGRPRGSPLPRDEGGMQGEGQRVLDGLDRFGKRIRHMHLKDCQPEIARQARTEGWDYFTAVQHGLFCELGRGNVPFASVAEWLRGHSYQGWMVVEQDILPGMGNPKASAQRNRSYLRTIGL